MNSFAQKNNLAFLRYDSSNICDVPQYFHNVRHLNNEGSTIFSEIISKDINKSSGQPN